jgi:hypothetical protein
MPPQNVVEVADRISRKRALGTALAAGAFLIIQAIVHPVFRSDYGLTGFRSYMWAINAAALLLFLLPLGGVAWGRRVRALVNDDISRHHARSGEVAGFWTAMIVALGVYVLPVGQSLTAREATYLVVTPATGAALLVFAWLEARAHRDG